MSESTANGYTSLTTCSKASIDLYSYKGDIQDLNGNSVHLGNIEGDSERENGDPNVGVDRVKDASPSGNLECDSNGNIGVAGYGTVTLTNAAGSREISTVGGTSGNASDLKTDGSGNLYGEYQTWVNRQHQTVDTTPSNTSSYHINGTNYAWDGSDQRNREVRGYISMSYTYSDTNIKWDLEVFANYDGDSDYDENSHASGTEADIERFSTTTIDITLGENSSMTNDCEGHISPYDDDSGDGNKEYFLASNPQHPDDGTLEEVGIEIHYEAYVTKTPSVSIY